MFSRIHSAVCKGIEGMDVYVETDIARGLPGINIVGLASTMVMESRERIKSAIVNSGLEYPRGRITVNLTPASLRKNGSGLDLPIAAGILTSSMYIDPIRASDYGIIGELSLEGCVLGVDGVLPMVIRLKKSGISKVIIPEDNLLETSLVSGIEICPVSTLRECIDIINSTDTGNAANSMYSAWSDADCLSPGMDDGEAHIQSGSLTGNEIKVDEDGVVISDHYKQVSSAALLLRKARSTLEIRMHDAEEEIGDFSDIRGQENAKRALTIAVAGRHGLLMVGSPGCGKTMLARRLPSIMPPMTEEELIETAVIYSAAGRTNLGGDIPLARPFRNPHCSIGRAGLVGGGMIPVPGEITLAHNGVLFMDEVCEFETATIEALRTPIEEKKIVHFRQGDNYVFPCDFQLVMAANPCPCGFFGDSMRTCKCSESQLEKYRKKLSGPMMDRIDMRIGMEKVEFDELVSGRKSQNTRKSKAKGSIKDASGTSAASTAEMRGAVERGISFAHRHGRTGFNASLSDSEIDTFCRLGGREERFMNRAYNALKLTPRSYKKTLKVARTIADLDESVDIHEEHLAEALSYRILDAVNE